MATEEGWVKLHRPQFSHWVSNDRPWCDGYAWSYLYARANYEDAVVNFKGHYIKVERGQFVTSKIKLQKTFGWGKKRLNSFLQSLQNSGMIFCSSNEKGAYYRTHWGAYSYLIITIQNYGKYQGNQKTEEPIKEPIREQLRRPFGATDKKNKEFKRRKEVKTFGKRETPFPLPDSDEDEWHVFDGWDLEDKASFLVDTWNRFAGREETGLPKITMTPERTATIQKKLVAFPDLMFEWASIMGRVAMNSFFQGNNPRNWRANFDWVLCGDNYLRLLNEDDLGSILLGDESQRRDPESPEPPGTREDTLGESLSRDASEGEEILF